MPPRGPSSPAARPAGRPRWSSSTWVTPTSRSSSGCKARRGAQDPGPRGRTASTWTLDGADMASVQYQNANNSVRVTDEFMQAVVDDADWHLRAVTTGEVVKTVRARDLMRQFAQATWECADPGMQFDTTINRWHTCANTDRINGSNPCSEYMHLDNSACNLASINLLQFLTSDGDGRLRRRRRSSTPSTWSSPPRRSWSAEPTTRPRRSPRRAATSVSSASATPTSAPLLMAHGPALRLRRGPRLWPPPSPR
ncbi:MAG: hypothetical protein U5K30_01810 [Acidimicrobiales bacterium]|nr:hypothetical protein [Acidimicrobiales bacterium]